MKDKELIMLFKQWKQEQAVIPIPLDHQQQFAKRLKKLNRSNRFGFYFYRVAVFILLVGLGSFWMLPFETPPTEIVQFQKAEMHFSRLIETQLEQLKEQSSPKVQKLLLSSQKKLALMRDDYASIYKKWEKNPMQPQLIAALIENLKLQSELLTQIHQKIIQIKKSDYETL